MTEPAFTLRPGAVTWQEVDGEAILLDLGSSTYLGANQTGTVLWSALAAGATRDELVAKLQDDFDIDREQAERDVGKFVDACRVRGFLA